MLSNTNALEVRGLQDFTPDKLVHGATGESALVAHRGQVLGFDNDAVDALRALEAFKPTQGWSLFRRPASLVREETLEIARDLVNATGESKETVRKVIFGGPGSGKSALLLQAQAMAFLKGFIVIHFPEAQDLTDAQTAYEPIKSADRTVYIQPHYAAKLLANIARANNRLLSTLRLSKQHQLPIPVQPNMSLSRFAELGAQDTNLAWPIWQAFWAEITTPSPENATDGFQRPPVFVGMDGVDQAMRMSAYLDPEVSHIHAHDLALVRNFMDLLSGKISLPNGGTVLAATCESNRAAAPTLDHCLKEKHAQQYNARLRSAGVPEQNPLPMPRWDLYAAKDARIEATMKDVRTLKLEGLSKDEARGIMEYYAQSGILRGTVTEGLVSEKWTLAGSGNIGELEKGAVRLRF